MFFSGWDSLLRTLVVGVLAYIMLIVFLRIAGKRTLSKMNAFDLVVTVALGSTLATILLTKSVALAEGALAFALLIALQFAVTWTSVRASWVRKLIVGEPLMLLYRGEFQPRALLRARVTEDEIRAAIRAHGLESLHMAHAVVLETDGSFSVVKKSEGADESSLNDVRFAHGIHDGVEERHEKALKSMIHRKDAEDTETRSLDVLSLRPRRLSDE